MRTFAILLLAGCLDAPTGKPATWPVDGVTVSAIAAGDLDGHGGNELAIVTADTLYVLPEGATDFTAAASLDGVSAPVAALIADHQLIVLHDSSSGPRVSLYDGTTLARIGDVGLGVPSATPMWISPVAFPGNSTRYAFAVGGSILHMTIDEMTSGVSPVPQLPAPSTTWTEPQAVASIDGAADIVVAERADIQKSVIPTEPPPQGTWSWSAVRTGHDWSGQAAVDLTGDGNPEIVGLDTTTTPAKLCAADPHAGTVTSCIDTSIPGMGGASATIAPHTGGGPDDILFESGGPTGAHLVVFPNLRDDSGTLSADPMLSASGLDSDTAFVAVDGHSIYTATAIGAIACWTPSGSALGSCP